MSASRHEPDTFDTGALLRTVALGAGLLILVLAAIWLGWRRWPERQPPPPATSLPPAPRLQYDPPPELAALRREQQARLQGYGWVDRAHGIARIPIERAMALEAERQP